MITIKVQTERDGILCGYNTHQSITQNLLSAVPIFFWAGEGGRDYRLIRFEVSKSSMRRSNSGGGGWEGGLFCSTE